MHLRTGPDGCKTVMTKCSCAGSGCTTKKAYRVLSARRQKAPATAKHENPHLRDDRPGVGVAMPAMASEGGKRVFGAVRRSGQIGAGSGLAES